MPKGIAGAMFSSVKASETDYDEENLDNSKEGTANQGQYLKMRGMSHL